LSFRQSLRVHPESDSGQARMTKEFYMSFRLESDSDRKRNRGIPVAGKLPIKRILGFVKGFSKKYGCKDLVYFEEYQEISLAIAREKQIKNWRRKKKENIIRKLNPSWRDLSLNLT
jgi:hypothetical protein